jgi:hypothetical protein
MDSRSVPIGAGRRAPTGAERGAESGSTDARLSFVVG